MIDIIVLYENNNIEQLKRTISSICYQQNAPALFVHINKKIDSNIIKHFSYFVQIDTDVNNLNGKYLMYINSGDLLVDPNSIKKLYKYKKYDIISGSYAKIIKKNKSENIYNDVSNFYGKLYNRSFVDTYKTNLNNPFENNELAFATYRHTHYLDDIIYLVTSSSKNEKKYLENVLETLNKEISLGLNKHVYTLATKTLIQMYHKRINYTLKDNIDLLQEIYKIYLKYKSNYKIDTKDLNYELTIMDYMPTISFNEFLKELEK